jgi:hypothetical protein
MLKRIGLFRYHNNLDGCTNRLELFKKLNPSIPVYGLYGGKEEDFPEFSGALRPYFEDNYCIQDKPDIWKWKNGDLAFREWYINLGQSIDFDVVHILEWDLIMFEPLDVLYQHVPGNGLGISGLLPLRDIEDRWFWTRNADQKNEWKELLEHVAAKHGYNDIPLASVAPGLTMPKKFLKEYAKEEIPDLVHDELRIPLFAQAFGFEIHDTGFFKKWFSKKEWKYFNCNDFPILEKRIKKQLRGKKGRRVFHPFREIINNEEYLRLKK